MNIGAKADDPKVYDFNTMKEDLNPGKLEDPAIKNMVLDKTSNAFNWIDQRGNTGDNIPQKELEIFHKAILEGKEAKALDSGVSILETKMHPTARDIITDSIKQFVYNVCGKRAYRYEKDA